MLPPEELRRLFAPTGSEDDRVAISSFVALVDCPHKTWHQGAASPRLHSQGVIDAMTRGTKRHEESARAIAAEGRARGLDTARESKSLHNINVDLADAPEINVSLECESLLFQGRADAVARQSATLFGIERKPYSRWHAPASRLQAMLYAVGAACSMVRPIACDRVGWAVTNYHGKVGPHGMLTEATVELIRACTLAYRGMKSAGISGENLSLLPGPTAGKCRSCEFVQSCGHRITDESAGRRHNAQVWTKYTQKPT